ncbi:hypothetical protein QR680_015529 [Steinernema hermaphroditum]|uniref:Zinc metalloproteinase n=1 Tax=Steinernema hermaphroditum TaxID=289476 RepID=A0AA39H8C7_9BILA|nr:hypothetical protein QR680_015529 [Steinernema hermaphroditum]
MASMHSAFALLVVLIAFVCALPTPSIPLKGAALLTQTKEKVGGLTGLSPDHYEKIADFINANKDRIGAKIKAVHEKKKEEFLKKKEEDKKKRKVKDVPVKPFTKKPKGRPSIADINGALGLDEALWDGDQDLTIDQLKDVYGLIDTTPSLRRKRQTKVDSAYPADTWTQGVPYMFDSSLTTDHINAIKAAIAFWQGNTCVKFTQVTSPSNTAVSPVIRFYVGSGCFSSIGRLTSGVTTQDISLGSGCQYTDIAAHEIGHALGMFHGQVRYDRDNWVWLDTANIIPAKMYNFQIVDSSVNYNYGMRYDTRSIMHYEANAFAVNKSSPTIYANDFLAQLAIGGSRIPTFTDVTLINNLYKCYDRCSSSSITCQNGGQRNPNSCSVCQCPSGFGGSDCSAREPSSNVAATCGSTLTATSNWQDLTVTKTVGNGQYAETQNASKCTWWIKAPAGQKVEFYLQRVGYDGADDAQCAEECHWGGVDVKWDSDKKPEGYRFCCPDQYYWSQVSNNELLVVQAFTYYYYTDFTLTYRAGMHENASLCALIYYFSSPINGNTKRLF